MISFETKLWVMLRRSMVSGFAIAVMLLLLSAGTGTLVFAEDDGSGDGSDSGGGTSSGSEDGGGKGGAAGTGENAESTEGTEDGGGKGGFGGSFGGGYASPESAMEAGVAAAASMGLGIGNVSVNSEIGFGPEGFGVTGFGYSVDNPRDGGADNGSSYYTGTSQPFDGNCGWFIEPINGNFVDVPCGSGSVYVLPNPSGLRASCDTATHQATFQWDWSAGVTSFLVRVHDNDYQWNDMCGTDGVPGNWCWNDYRGGSPPTATLSIPGLYGRLYTWWVHTCGPSGCSDGVLGNPISCTPPLAAPTIVHNTCINRGTQVNVRWSAVPGAIKYYPRIRGISDSQCLDPVRMPGWQWNGSECYHNDYRAEGAILPLTPGGTHRIWVHAGDPIGPLVSTGDFRCPLPPTVTVIGGVDGIVRPSGTIIAPNQELTVRWQVSGDVTSCSGESLRVQGTGSGSQNFDPAGTVIVPGESRRFSVTCMGPGGVTTDAVTYGVDAPTLSYRAEQTLIRRGATTPLVWSVQNTATVPAYTLECSIRGGVSTEYAELRIETGTQGMVSSLPIESKVSSVLTCREPISGYEASEEAIVEVVPEIEEG